LLQDGKIRFSDVAGRAEKSRHQLVDGVDALETLDGAHRRGARSAGTGIRSIRQKSDAEEEIEGLWRSGLVGFAERVNRTLISLCDPVIDERSVRPVFQGSD